MNRFAFEGRTAVVTGAGSGIGRALAAALAARGCHLALADINEDALAETAAGLASNERRVSTRRLDVSNRGDVWKFAREVKALHGGASLVVNNAGIAVGGTFDRVEETDFDRVMAVNFEGVVAMSRAFLPQLLAAEQAQLVNISSIFGVIAPPGQTAYCASKFAVRGFSNALRHELMNTHVGVTTVHPGGVATNIAASAKAPADATAEEIAEARERAAKSLVMAPRKAADIILRGVERRRARVLVGRDAHVLAILERLFPVGYMRPIASVLGTSAARRADANAPQPSEASGRKSA